MKASAKLEVRYNRDKERTLQTLITTSSAWRLNQDLSLLTEYEEGITTNQTQDTTQAKFKEIGLGIV